MQEKMIRVFIIEDDQQIIIPGLRSLFRPSRDGIDFSGSAPTVEDAIATADPLSFDLFFLDLYLPGKEPQKNMELLKRFFPTKPVIIYTTEESSVWKRKMYSAGAMAYLTKKDDKARMKYVIKTVASGQSVFHGLADKEEQEKFTVTLLDQSTPISSLEKRVVIKLGDGLTLKEISEDLGISLSAIDKILMVLRDRFKAKNNTQLVRNLADAGMI